MIVIHNLESHNEEVKVFVWALDFPSLYPNVRPRRLYVCYIIMSYNY